MSAEDGCKSYLILRLVDSMVLDYHDSKANPRMPLESHAKYLDLSLEDVEMANRSIERIKFSAAEYLAKGFDVSEYLGVTQFLSYRLHFPSRPIVFLEPNNVYLDETKPPTTYSF